MITYKKSKNKTNKWDVQLDGKKCGEIIMFNQTTFQYIPKGQKEGGEFFKSLAECFKSLS